MIKLGEMCKVPALCLEHDQRHKWKQFAVKYPGSSHVCLLDYKTKLSSLQRVAAHKQHDAR